MMFSQMTDYQLDRAVESYYDRMYDLFYGDDGRCCANCRYFVDGRCERKLDDLTDEEYEEMEKNDDFSEVEVDDDDYCDDYDYDDSNEPDPDYEYERERDEW